MKIYILAKCHAEAQRVAQVRGLRPLDWRYARSAQDLRGIGQATVLATECWADGRHWAEVAEIRGVLMRGAVLTPVECP